MVLAESENIPQRRVVLKQLHVSHMHELRGSSHIGLDRLFQRRPLLGDHNRPLRQPAGSLVWCGSLRRRQGPHARQRQQVLVHVHRLQTQLVHAQRQAHKPRGQRYSAGLRDRHPPRSEQLHTVVYCQRRVARRRRIHKAA